MIHINLDIFNIIIILSCLTIISSTVFYFINYTVSRFLVLDKYSKVLILIIIFNIILVFVLFNINDFVLSLDPEGPKWTIEDLEQSNEEVNWPVVLGTVFGVLSIACFTYAYFNGGKGGKGKKPKGGSNKRPDDNSKGPEFGA